MERTSGTRTIVSRQPLVALVLVLAVSAVLSCRLLGATPEPTPTTPASAGKPTERDEEYALAYTGSTFDLDEWERSLTVSDRVRVTWRHREQSALASSDYTIWPRGYTRADVESYYSEQNFQEIILRDYQNPQRTATCTQGDLTLHHFTARVGETNYAIRFWIKLDSETRVIDMLIAFPVGSETELDRYAREVFPELSSCQR